jgi:hypothetical protein
MQMASSFDLDQFIADCRAARDTDASHKLVREVVARAVCDPAAILKGSESQSGRDCKSFTIPRR